MTRARRSTSSPPRPATRPSPAGRATAPTSRARATLVVEGTPSVTAHFTAQHAVSVKKAGAGAGGVVSEPGGLDCGAVCVGFFTDGQTVTLSAVPSGHSTFTGWSGAGCSGTDVCEVEAGEATTTVTATFAHDAADVVTDPAVTFVGQHVATVHGSVDPNGAAVTGCVVEYGTGPGYGAEQPCAPSSVGNGDAPVAVGVDLARPAAGHDLPLPLHRDEPGGVGLRGGPDAAHPRRHL